MLYRVLESGSGRLLPLPPCFPLHPGDSNCGKQLHRVLARDHGRSDLPFQCLLPANWEYPGGGLGRVHECLKVGQGDLPVAVVPIQAQHPAATDRCPQLEQGRTNSRDSPGQLETASRSPLPIPKGKHWAAPAGEGKGNGRGGQSVGRKEWLRTRRKSLTYFPDRKVAGSFCHSTVGPLGKVGRGGASLAHPFWMPSFAHGHRQKKWKTHTLYYKV